MISKISPILAAAFILPACFAEGDLDTGSAELASEMDMDMDMDMDMGGHEGMHCEPAPVMLSGDFNGNGIIDAGDLDMIDAYLEAGDYAAYFDMNADGVLNGQDVSAVAQRMGEVAAARDAQMAELWATTEPYRNIGTAMANGYTPFTPDLYGHGIHFANFGLINSWGSHGFQADAPEGLNYTADGRLTAAFYYAPGAIDLYDYGYYPEPDVAYQNLAVPASFDGLEAHTWHNHIGACFGGATSPVPGFDQCTTEDYCQSVGGQLWSGKFHMLHVWMFEYNQCGPFAGIDPDISVDAPEEPNHMSCQLADIVPYVVNPI